MTNPPYATGPANDPHPPPRPGGAAAPPAGPAANPAGNPHSFQYRPHDPYGTFAAGQPSGPVLPPAPTFRQRWGILAKDDRPRQVTVMLQALWIYLATATVVVIVGAIMAAVAFSTLGFLYGVVLGLVSAVVCLVLIWAVAREQLGRFGSHHPRTTLYIGLGVLGFNAVLGVFSFLTFVPAVVQAAAVLLCLVLIFTKPVKAWFKERPGNLPRNDSGQRADSDGQPLGGYRPPEPPQWRETGPVVQRPPAVGPAATQGPPGPANPNAHNGWPQPPR